MLRKILSVCLAFTLVCTLGVSAFAVTTGDRVTEIIKPIDFNADIDTSEVRPGAKLLYPLTADMFEWNSKTVYGKEAVTTQHLRGVSIDFRDIDNTIMKTPTLVPATVNGMRTVCVQLEFTDEWHRVDTVDFDFMLFLRLSRERMTVSEIQVEGTFGHAIKEIGSSDSWVAMSDDFVIESTDNLRDFECEISGFVVMLANLSRNRKYYGYAEDQVTDDDMQVANRYGDLVTVIRLYTVNLPQQSKSVQIDGYPDCHVYDKNGKYLGSANDKVDYSSLYYIMDSKVDMGGGVASGSSSSSSRSSSAGSAPSSEGSPPPASGAAPNNTVVITRDYLNPLTRTAVATARNNGSKTASVTVKSAKSVSPEALSSMQGTASASGMNGQLNCDTMSGRSVAGRLTIFAASASNLQSDVSTGVFTDSASTGSTKTKFNTWYSNPIQVVSLAQKGSYGMNVTVSAKVSLSGIDRENIVLYSYDRARNSFRRLENTSQRVDANGYLQFRTSVGNDIIVSDGLLTRK